MNNFKPPSNSPARQEMNLSLKEILLKSTDYLKNKGVANARYDTELIISHFLNIPRMNVYLEFERLIPEELASKVRSAIVDRGKRKPLQYIVGNTEFLDCVIEVNEDVLIPRSETEFMVDFVINDTLTLPSVGIKVLDLCTGSGVIAIALKKRLKASIVYAADVCDKALGVARGNAEKNGCEINFVRSDLFEDLVTLQGSYDEALVFDLIVCNPPYVSEEEYANLEPEIYFEPKIALVAQNNGLYFYEKILKEAKNFLKENGLLYLEIGSEQADEIIKIAIESKYTEYTVHKDLCDRNRIVRIKK